MRFLLDTCTFLWMVSDKARLSEIHKDPFDRMLICQAIAHSMIILTPDPLITQYPVRTV